MRRLGIAGLCGVALAFSVGYTVRAEEAAQPTGSPADRFRAEMGIAEFNVKRYITAERFLELRSPGAVTDALNTEGQKAPSEDELKADAEKSVKELSASDDTLAGFYQKAAANPSLAKAVLSSLG